MIMNQTDKHTGSHMMDQLENLDNKDSCLLAENDSSEDLRAVCNIFIHACTFTHENAFGLSILNQNKDM